MALFTDGFPSSIEDLTKQDSQLLTVASVEGIDVTQKLALAQEELGIELHEALSRLAYAEPFLWTADPQKLDRVVVTHPLRLWHACRTLELVYGDAYNSQLNDRYAAKRDQFQKMGARAYEKLIGAGIGINLTPIPKAASPVLAAVSGSLPDGTYYATASWVNEAGQEGACAEETSIATSSSTFAAQMGKVPAMAIGWNLYAGGDPGAMTLQNAAPIAPGAAWVQPNAMPTTGRGPGNGQKPNYFQPAPRMIQRG
jgi:hypothetical protein